MTPFTLFTTLFAMYTGLDPQVFDKKFDGEAIKTWNSTMNALGKKTGVEYRQYKEMFYFAYVHNPLNLPINEYGATKTYYRVASRYKAWKIQYQTEIDKKGFMRVLFDTKPGNLSDLDRELLKDFE